MADYPETFKFTEATPQIVGIIVSRKTLETKYGEREVFNGMRPPGSKIDLPVPDTGAGARMKVFLNGILVEEKDL